MTTPHNREAMRCHIHLQEVREKRDACSRRTCVGIAGTNPSGATDGDLRLMLTGISRDTHSVRTSDGWEGIEFHVDSVATGTVVSDDMLMTVETRDGIAKCRGVQI